MSSSRSKSATYPPPLVIPPLDPTKHTHTIILLHGRGSNSERFGQEFLASTGIARRLPTTKFIFPTASKRRSTVLKRTPINQWFDNYSLEDPNTRTELQLDGLKETGAFLRKLVEEEAGILSGLEEGNGDGYSRVIIGGLSQGCAAALGGFIGMSGWLPLEGEMSAILGLDENSDEDADEDKDDEDPFDHDSDSDAEDGSGPVPAHVQAVNHVRDVLELELLPAPASAPDQSQTASFPIHFQTPVFLGHGAADPKVSVRLGQHMASVLSGAKGFNMDVTWKAYEEFGHWYQVPDEVVDILAFLREKTSVFVVDVDRSGSRVVRLPVPECSSEI
ncbi:Alpha/Beta hydrolase protein [Aspergillus stella-maris]|uniref:Alpha/Beta hydrolase protein n=1 Tax=Aspergillus stella-maris TaxID=1810926 RepID=UPI003CCCC0AB